MAESKVFNWPIVDFFLSKGAIAVEIFFMISGFCMASRWKSNDCEGYHVPGLVEYFTHYYFRFVGLALLTMPVAIAKQITVYYAGLDGAPNLSNAILDIFCIRAGWGISASPPYNGPFWFINVLLIMYLLFWVIVKNAKEDPGIFCLESGLLTITGLFILSNKLELVCRKT